MYQLSGLATCLQGCWSRDSEIIAIEITPSIIVHLNVALSIECMFNNGNEELKKSLKKSEHM